MKAAAIILCAGESRRMGRPKAYLPFRGGTFLSELSRLFAPRCSPVIAVFGHDAEKLMDQAPDGVLAIANLWYEAGMLTSLQAGLRAVPADCDTVLFTLVDHPAITVATVETLMQSGAAIAIPRLNDKRGHPVLVRRRIFEEFLLEPVTAKTRDVIDRHAAEIEYIEVNDPGIADDIDDPQLYESLLAREDLE